MAKSIARLQRSSWIASPLIWIVYCVACGKTHFYYWGGGDPDDWFVAMDKDKPVEYECGSARIQLEFDKNQVRAKLVEVRMLGLE